MLVIARLLDPKDFGLVGMLAIFWVVAQSLIDSGLRCCEKGVFVL